MAETLLSPGVLARENDLSAVTAQPIQAGAAIIGPTVKGPVGIPTLVTSYSEYTQAFGTTFLSASLQQEFLTSNSAYNYFNNGGTTLLVTRVVSGSFTSATSTNISGSALSTKTTSFTLKTFGEGTIMNSSGSEVNGALVSGSNDNLRWEIPQFSTSSGTFTLLVRRGSDTTDAKTVLESFTNLSLDPTAPNYISKVIGDSYKTVNTSDTTPYVQDNGTYPNKSRYVYISAVNAKTPQYFDNNGDFKGEFTSSLPQIASGSFESATGQVYFETAGAAFNEQIVNSENIQGLNNTNYTTSIDLLSNQDEYIFNSITVPGIMIETAPSTTTKLINMVQERGDAIAIVDASTYGATINSMTSEASSYNSSYAAVYAPWLQTTSPETGELVWVPASTMIPGVYAYNDRVGEAWFAPAGLNRGGLATVVRPERKFSQSNRDTLYQGKVNPIASFPGSGTVVFGQKTLQTKASALDRVNVRRLLIQLKSYISQVADNLVFEQNTIATRNAFLSQVNPYLESVQQRQGLYAFKVIMDSSNNTADVIDRNQLIGQIYLQPTKTAEFIYLDFNVLPTGATFPA
jgi:phage tail sheath protein FI